MKTSNKLLLTATLIAFSYLFIYDVQLKIAKANYHVTDQRHHIELKSFTTIINKAGNLIGLSIEKGPKFEMWISKSMLNDVVINQSNDTLYISYPHDKYHWTSSIAISCPSVNSVTTKIKRIPNLNDQSWMGTSISSFKQDVLNVSVDELGEIELSKNVLNKLNATSNGSKAFLTVHSDNQIKAADINMIGKSDLKLFCAIPRGNYTYSDSATVTLNGKSFHQLQQK